MKTALRLVMLMLICACQSRNHEKNTSKSDVSFKIAFGSCNNQNLKNELWDDILSSNPDLWIWGGDNIYADTEQMEKMAADYAQLKRDSGYLKIQQKMDILGTWDDHDYGWNDAGEEYSKKDSSQQLFLNFLNVPMSDTRRKRRGVYHSKVFPVGDKSVKVIVLDTRYFRTRLTPDPSGVKRYIPNKTEEGTILGEDQWKWLADELTRSNSEFNIIVSSIQFLSFEHGWETWGTMPHEVQKMNSLIVESKAKNVLFLSGDRHISEISRMTLSGLNYPIYDFTASGLTHTYEEFQSEVNTYRVSKVIHKKNFGLLQFNLNTNVITMEIIGNGNAVLERITQQY